MTNDCRKTDCRTNDCRTMIVGQMIVGKMDTNQLQFQTEIFLEYNIQEHKVKDDIYQTQNLEY